MEAITITESARFVELEKIIQRGKQTFIEVGTALAEIRDSKLYRSDFDTFDAYCKSKWGFSKRYAYQIIESAEAVKSLPESKCTIVRTESQARELAKVEPEKREAVLHRAAESAQISKRPMTARDIKDAAQVFEPPANESPLPVNYGDFPDPEETPTPPTLDDKWKNAFGGNVPKIQRELTDDESKLEAIAMGVRDNADLVMSQLRDLDENALEEIDTSLTEFRKVLRVVIHERLNIVAP